MTNMFSNITIFAQANDAAPAVVQESAPATTTTAVAPDAAAPAGEEAAPQGQGFPIIAIYILLFLGIFFLMFMPQRKQRKAMQKLQSELKAGDTIVTGSGIYGKIVSLNETKATLEIAQGRIEVARSQIVAKVS
ncbi:MAG: preprotein translocase subunit YajC [Opitutae bacterium]|nr:preprotein translocase subunit YajC [Opitutae bacterium]